MDKIVVELFSFPYSEWQPKNGVYFEENEIIVFIPYNLIYFFLFFALAFRTA